jgi:hypothetical protein
VTTAFAGPVTGSTAPLSLGDFLFSGHVDELRIWRSTRTQQQIRTRMNTALTGHKEGLAGYWNFDEGSGQAAFDSSSSGYVLRLGSKPGMDPEDPRWVTSSLPSFHSPVSSQGGLRLSAASYPCQATSRFEVCDLDMTGLVFPVEFRGFAGEDVETVTTEVDSLITGLFHGKLPTAPGIALPGDGILQISQGEVGIGTYLDPDNGAGASSIQSATVVFDCTVPEGILYVSAGARGTGNGSTWPTPSTRSRRRSMLPTVVTKSGWRVGVQRGCDYEARCL